MATFWTSLGKFGLFLFNHLVTLNNNNKTCLLSRSSFFRFKFKIKYDFFYYPNISPFDPLC